MKKRIVETNDGIQGEITVLAYDQMQRYFRDKGLMETDSIIKSGISKGLVLEIGPGPGYLGLEWLKKTNETKINGVEISKDMIAVALKNAKEYNLLERVKYVEGRAEEIPFNNETFDAVFSNSSLHEWNNPEKALNEIHRVLKNDGKFYISDLKRNLNFFVFCFMNFFVKTKEIKAGFKTSVAAAYTKSELEDILNKTNLKSAQVSENLMGLTITGKNKYV